MNTLLDIPKGAEVIDVCKAVEEMMNASGQILQSGCGGVHLLSCR